MAPRLDHVGLDVSDYEVSKAFYDKTLAPLGMTLMMEPVDRGAFVLDPDGNNVEAVCHTPA
jgi:catechol 2,3-dioxygenase-like lactoylglutathione lyase family enzyme